MARSFDRTVGPALLAWVMLLSSPTADLDFPSDPLIEFEYPSEHFLLER